MDPQGHQSRGGCIDQISCQHGPESLIWDSKWSCGARVEGPSNVGPLALEEKKRGILDSGEMKDIQ